MTMSTDERTLRALEDLRKRVIALEAIHGGSAEREEEWTPRVFLGVWSEVRTFEEAEPADAMPTLGSRVCVLNDTLDTAYSDFPLDRHGGYWVRRIPADASERDDGMMPTALYEANERVKLLEGLLDDVLSELIKTGSPYMVEQFRKQRAGK